MKLAVRQTTRTRIGVDAGGAQIKAVQLSRKGGQFHLDAMAVLPRVEPGAAMAPQDVQRLTSMLFRQGFVGNELVLGAPSSQLVSSVFPVPPADSGAPRDQIIRMELSRTHGCDPTQLEAVSWELPKSRRAAGTQPSVMAVGYPHGPAGTLIDAFEKQGMQVPVMDVEWMASLRAVWPTLGIGLGGEVSPVVALVDLGEQAARITVVWGSVVVYGRSLPEFGLDKIKSQIEESFGLANEDVEFILREVSVASLESSSPTDGEGNDNTNDDNTNEACEQDRRQTVPKTIDPYSNVRSLMRKFFSGIAEELRRSVAYAEEEFSGEAKRIALIGGGAGIAGVDALIEESVGVETMVASPVQLLHCPPGRERMADDPSLITAIGLAMYGHGGAI